MMFVCHNVSGAKTKRVMFALSGKYRLELRHPRLEFMMSNNNRERNARSNREKQIIISTIKKIKMSIAQTAAGLNYMPLKWESARISISDYLKSVFNDVFLSRTAQQQQQQAMLIKELQLKTTELERLKRDLLQKEELLKKMSYHQSHTVRRPLANILGITKLIAANIQQQPNAELTKLMGLLQSSSDELDEAIKDNH
jgi:signal transduction histidine kinase